VATQGSLASKGIAIRSSGTGKKRTLAPLWIRSIRVVFCELVQTIKNCGVKAHRWPALYRAFIVEVLWVINARDSLSIPVYQAPSPKSRS
jgi:hypothetical protein